MTTHAASVWPANLSLLGIAAALAGIFRFWGHQHDWKSHVPEFIALALVAGALYLIGVYLVARFTLGAAALLIIIGSALIFRAFLLPLNPSLSEDVYRYQWEGRVQRLHLNPYTVFPAVPALRQLEDPEHPLETARSTPTLYPPLSEAAFSWVETIPAYKRLFTGLDLASLGVLLLTLAVLKQPLHRVLAYAWNPTVLVSFAMCGHHDSLAVFTLLMANFFILAHKPLVSTVFLALSTLSKLFPVLLLPAFVAATCRVSPGNRARHPSGRLDPPAWVYVVTFAATAAIAYLPYLGAGWKLFRGLSDYAAGWEANDSVFRLMVLAGNSKAQAELTAAVLVLALVAYILKKRIEPLRASLLVTAGVVLLSPNAFPWYFTWSIPFLCFYPNVAWLLMSTSAVLAYSPVVAYAAGQSYRDSTLILALEYAPVLLWLGFEGWRSLKQD